MNIKYIALSLLVMNACYAMEDELQVAVLESATALLTEKQTSQQPLPDSITKESFVTALSSRPEVTEHFGGYEDASRWATMEWGMRKGVRGNDPILQKLLELKKEAASSAKNANTLNYREMILSSLAETDEAYLQAGADAKDRLVWAKQQYQQLLIPRITPDKKFLLIKPIKFDFTTYLGSRAINNPEDKKS